MGSALAERVAEIALVLLLFSDAARLDLQALRRELSWPTRLLLIGLPRTMIAGVGAGVLVFPGTAFASTRLLATMLASTDAGQKVVTDTAVPARTRQALDVEGGLNDGLVVPFFLVALDIASAELETLPGWAVVQNTVVQIGGGLTAGSRPASWAGCCSASQITASGSAVNGGRSSRSRWRWWITPSP
ncbi:cation:proton antiporter [Microbacterium sp. M3]|uniref:Cation:proton antiporter n=1 Tax=Microbacterium arthrosphaerae TaxID=792652 RepID=A0ABU4H1M4_9MICO|nr:MULTISPECIES: cation:proton antiporter [Microbacterium]MDW4573242.1 cation:proton antiporter [Microbacterium arthrosphaerae]MDW7607097.1 cation:proton antiporter [Microbacterium sp. M3]